MVRNRCAPAFQFAFISLSIMACGGNDAGVGPPYTETTASAQAAVSTGLKIGIYSGTGAEPDKTLALYRAVAAVGHSPMAITRNDILNGRLTRANFDVFILPAGEDGKRCCAGHYSDDGDALGGIPAQNAIRAYLNSGGGMVAVEAGAFFASKNGGTLDVYLGDYTNVTNQIGKRTLTLADPSFGSGTLESWNSYGGGYFAVAAGATVVARNASSQPVIVRNNYGAGRVIMTSLVLELRGDSELDWTIWDNWAMGGVHANSAANWGLLGRMIGWAYNGDASAPSVTATNPTGSRVAVVATHTTDGGAWAGLLPAVARATEYAGHLPLAIRFQDIKDGRLTSANFKVVVVPGGYSYGYKLGLSGHEQKIRDFISAGGGYLGICAGGFYAPDSIVWESKTYTYPLQIYKGQDIGPINDIITYPSYALTPTAVDDSLLGVWPALQQLYYGGGYFTIPTDQQQGSHVSAVATYDYGGSAGGQADIVRYTYGTGHVVLTGTHPESRSGTTVDWLFWDGFDNDQNPLQNPDNPWELVDSAFDNWLTL